MFKNLFHFRALLLVVATVALVREASSNADPHTQASSEPKPLLRGPVAMVLADEGRLLYVANRNSGSVSVIDAKARKVISEVDVGKRLSDLIITPDGRHLLVCDDGLDVLFVLSRKGADLHLESRLGLSMASPVSLSVNASGSRCYVAGLWSRQLLSVDLTPEPENGKRIVLPFAPRRQLLVQDKLIAADSFGGRLAVIDLERGAVESVRTLPAHNIRGLALSRNGQELWIAHQILNPLAQTTFDDVHWGNLLTNNVRVLSKKNVLDPGAELLQGSRLHYLGDVGHAAGDPSQVVLAPTGIVLVGLAGADEVAIGREKKHAWQRIPVGRRPTAMVVSPSGDRAYVANHFADSISIIDLKQANVVGELSLGKQAELKPSDRGERLFYDARLSHDGWLSCNSCHTDGHTNGLLNDNLGDGSFGAPKRVLSLLGVGATAPYAWLGIVPDLESQIRKSILTTMHGRAPSDAQVRDLAAYLKTLSPPPGLGSLAGNEVSKETMERGEKIFDNQGCARCHAPTNYTSPKTYDVGLRDEVGNARFNPPSLRGVSQGGPYFHDNRAATLEEVVGKYRHQLKSELSEQEQEDLLSFLRSL